MNEHLYDYKLKIENFVLCTHCKENDEREEQWFVYQVRDVFGSNAALKQVTEAVNIRMK